LTSEPRAAARSWLPRQIPRGRFDGLFNQEELLGQERILSLFVHPHWSGHYQQPGMLAQAVRHRLPHERPDILQAYVSLSCQPPYDSRRFDRLMLDNKDRWHGVSLQGKIAVRMVSPASRRITRVDGAEEFQCLEWNNPSQICICQ